MDAQKNQKRRDLIWPIIIMFLSTCVVMGCFYWIKSWDSTLVQPVMDVVGEETDPCVGRLICCAMYFVLAVLSALLAVKTWEKNPERLPVPFTFAAFGGSFLWVSVGECLWHFGMSYMDEEQVVGFGNFPRLESFQGLILFLLVAILVIVLFRRIDFPLIAFVLVFLANWGGHLFTVATYPLFLAFGLEITLADFYWISSLVQFIFFGVIAALIYIFDKKREARYFAAILLYVSLGGLVFGVILGET